MALDLSLNQIYIGTGMLFPMELTEKDGKLGWYPVEEDPALIEHNLRTLFEYQIGQRIRQEYYGSRLWECIEEPSTTMLLHLASSFIKEAITAYEPRIAFKKLTGYIEGSKMYLTIHYTLVGTSTQKALELEFKDLNSH